MRTCVLLLAIIAGLGACADSSRAEPTPALPAASSSPPLPEIAKAPDEAPAKEDDVEIPPDQEGAAKAGPELEGPGAGVELIVLHAHELLGSEGRALDKLKSRLENRGLEITRLDDPDSSRKDALSKWLSTRDPAARSKLPRTLALGEAAAVIVISLRKPGGSKGKVGAGQDRLGVLARRQELLWMEAEGTGLALVGDLDEELADLVEPLEGAKG
jgi:hypothetical protein